MVTKSYPWDHDLLVCLFGAALASSRKTELVKPYPIQFYDSQAEEIDINRLSTAIADITPLINDSSSSSGAQADEDFKNLLDWIVNRSINLNLKHISTDQMKDDARSLLLKNTTCANLKALRTKNTLQPNHVFELTQTNQRTTVFERYKRQYGSSFAFHGSSLENFHSILHHGLAFSMNKRMLYGQGTYLSSNLSMAVLYSPYTYSSFNHSRLGSRLSCVALCEVIKHPDVILKGDGAYYVIPNNELIRVAYLLIYSSKANLNATNPQEEYQIIHQIQKVAELDNLERIYSTSFLLILLMTLFVIGFVITKPAS